MVETKKKRVAIIGGGISGLLAIKACLEEEMEPHCFERYSQLGRFKSEQRPNQNRACLVRYLKTTNTFFWKIVQAFWSKLPEIFENGFYKLY